MEAAYCRTGRLGYGHADSNRKVRGAPDAPASFVEHVRIDHRCAHFPVAEEILDCPDIVPFFQEMGSEGMPVQFFEEVPDFPSREDNREAFWLFLPEPHRQANPVRFAERTDKGKAMPRDPGFGWRPKRCGPLRGKTETLLLRAFQGKRGFGSLGNG